MRNLARLTNAANRLEAQKDWDALAARARKIGINPDSYAPSVDAGWRIIDKAIAKLRLLVEAGETKCPDCGRDLDVNDECPWVVTEAGEQEKKK